MEVFLNFFQNYSLLELFWLKSPPESKLQLWAKFHPCKFQTSMKSPSVKYFPPRGVDNCPHHRVISNGSVRSATTWQLLPPSNRNRGFQVDICSALWGHIWHLCSHRIRNDRSCIYRCMRMINVNDIRGWFQPWMNL